MSLRASTLPEGFAAPGSDDLPLTIRQSVYWGDMDSYGHVNNAVYLKWLENVRFELFERIGMNRLHAEEKKGPILARATLDFLAPVAYPDELLLSVAVSRLGNKSFTLRNLVWSLGAENLCARGEAVIVMVDYGSGATIPVPPAIRDALGPHAVE